MSIMCQCCSITFAMSLETGEYCTNYSVFSFLWPGIGEAFSLRYVREACCSALDPRFFVSPASETANQFISLCVKSLIRAADPPDSVELGDRKVFLKRCRMV